MLFALLPQAEQDTWKTYAANLRAMSGELARVLNRLNDLNNEYNTNIVPIVANLDDSETIPDESGLSGTSELTETEIINLTSYVQTALTVNTAAHRQMYIQAAGLGNVISNT